MRIRSKRQGIKAARKAVHIYEGQYASLNKVRNEILASKNALLAELKESYQFLSEGLLQSIDQASTRLIGEEIGMIYLDNERIGIEEIHHRNIERKKEISMMNSYKQRVSLIGQPSGSFLIALENANREMDSAVAQLKVYEGNKDFRILYSRKQKEPRNWFVNFVETIFGVKWYYELKAKKVLQAIDGDLMDELFFDYEICRKNITKAGENVEAKQKQISDVEKLVSEHDNLHERIIHYKSDALMELQNRIAAYFEDHSSLKDVHNRIRVSARSMVASMLAKKEQISYYDQMIKEAQKEMNDRMQKGKSIERVQKIWQRYPKGGIKGDKRKWLVDLPHEKAVSTHKRINWLNSMHYNIQHFDEYDIVSRLLYSQVPFLTYDLIARFGQERMPYDGYAQKVIQEVSFYREEHRLKKPNYRQLNQWIKEADSYEEVRNEEIENAAIIATIENATPEINNPPIEEIQEIEELSIVEEFADIS